MSLDCIVSVDRLTKTYGSFSALNDCRLTVARGSVFGLLGPNGAGKTTLIRSLLGYIRPTSGVATIDGFDCLRESVKVRSRVAYLPAEARLFHMMRGGAVIDFFSSIHPSGSKSEALTIAKRLNLDLKRHVGFMSTGMKQKLAIACVMSCDVPLIVLDEPTANLDPNVRSEVLSLIREAHASGKTILFSSHILSEIEELGDHASVMRDGRVVATIDLHQMRSKHRVLGQITPEAWQGLIKSLPGEVSVVAKDEAQFVIEVSGPLESQLKWLSSFPLSRVRIEPVGLKSVYESCCAS